MAVAGGWSDAVILSVHLIQFRELEIDSDMLEPQIHREICGMHPTSSISYALFWHFRAAFRADKAAVPRSCSYPTPTVFLSQISALLPSPEPIPFRMIRILYNLCIYT